MRSAITAGAGPPLLAIFLNAVFREQLSIHAAPRAGSARRRAPPSPPRKMLFLARCSSSQDAPPRKMLPLTDAPAAAAASRTSRIRARGHQ
mmetsp:Transcript_2555/g.7780  ORF Transcript_2555/g.7780 Transcript_2555/m.7780 type:complete len:91 (-) Transcript_2555:167-439(-)